jgi:hypothetical protein
VHFLHGSGQQLGNGIGIGVAEYASPGLFSSPVSAISAISHNPAGAKGTLTNQSNFLLNVNFLHLQIQPLRQQLFTRIFDNANFVVVNTPGPNDSQSINGRFFNLNTVPIIYVIYFSSIATPAAPKKRGRPPRKRTQPEKENHALKQQPQEQWPLVEVARLGQNAGMTTPSLHLNRSGKDASDKEMSLTSNRPFDEVNNNTYYMQQKFHYV